MLLWKGLTTHSGTSVIEIVRAMERASNAYKNKGSTLQQFIEWSLTELDEPILLREIALGGQLDDETLALSYLLLLEQQGIGELETTASSQ